MSKVRIVLPGVIILALFFAIGKAGIETLNSMSDQSSEPVATAPASIPPANTLAAVPNPPPYPPVAAAIKAFAK